ncbi:hypothetical protein KBD61_01570 [Patescibacteria group bacterium]|nr:hypothetical protein [Patescibacteria group bacterium]MBP9709698.1 hypothetical protein [Patescibacteria group bacterium]
MRARLASWSWWIGVPIIMGLFAWLPYWILNLAGGQEHWWRVPILTPGLFDTYTYLFWIGASVQDLGYGYNLSIFRWILQAIWKLTSGWASIPELWILSRWLSLVFILWVGAWAIRVWSGLSLKWSRLIALALWLSLIMTLALRPGIYAWYLPFCLAGLGAVALAWEHGQANRFAKAGAWAIAALALSSLYPWFFIVIFLWLAALFTLRFLPVLKWWLLGALALLPCLLIPLSLWLARWFLAPQQAGMMGLYERTGIVFSHAPFVSNTVLAIAVWIGLFFVIGRSRLDQPTWQISLTVNGSAWIALFVTWFNTPFTGLFFYPDHFIIVVAVLGWFSFASVLNALPTFPAHAFAKRRLDTFILWGIFLGSTTFFFYVLQQPLRFNLRQFYSYIIHLVVWFVPALTAGCLLWREQRGSIPSLRGLRLLILVISSLLGIGGVAVLIAGDTRFVSPLTKRAPAITWMREHVPPSDSICSDEQTATFFAGHTGLIIRPAEATFISYESRLEVQTILETIATIYRPTSQEKQHAYLYTLEHFLAMPCTYRDQYSQSWFYRPILRLFKQDTPTELNTFFGCREDLIQSLRSGILSAMQSHNVDPTRVYTMCSWVIVPETQAQDWHLPPGYSRAWNGGGMTFYTASSSTPHDFVSK